jgi:hypothetical protein
MEKKFYHENFESSLKEDADQFKMYPSKQVWHGIYNNVHPGRRWPSVAISFLCIFTLVIVGHLNTANPPRSDSKIRPIAETSAGTNKHSEDHPQFSRIDRVKHISNSHATSPVTERLNTTDPTNSTESDIVVSALTTQNNIPLNPTPLPANKEIFNTVLQYETNSTSVQKPTDNTVYQVTNDQVTNDHLFTKISNELPTGNLAGIILPLNISSLKSPLNETATINNPDKENKPQSATGNLSRARKNKLSWTIFITPSISYRTYSQQDKSAYLNTPLNALAYTNNIEEAIERASLGIQSGTSINYNITKKLKFTAGMQVSYSEFNKKATNVHPTIATLILTNPVTGNPYSLTAFSNYGNRANAAELSLHNYSFQGGTPVGLQYTIGGNDRMKFDLLTTFQPTYVILSQAYLLSSNNKNFISEPSLSRKWNMGISLGTLLSFGSDFYKWQIGPNVDYQLLSTYDSRYPVKEHLINYGVKLGITKIRK